MRPHAEIRGAVARSNRPAEIAARQPVDLLGGGQTGSDETVPDLLDRGPLQNRARGSRHREVGVRCDLFEAERTEDTGEGPTEGEVDPTPGEQHTESGVQLVGQSLLRARLVDTGQWLERGIGVLDDQPSTRAQGSGQRIESPLPPGQVDEHQSGVDEVERAGG